MQEEKRRGIVKEGVTDMHTVEKRRETVVTL